MTYKLSYLFQLEFSSAVTAHQYALRLLPRLLSGIQVHWQHFIADGEHDAGALSDGFGNRLVYGQYLTAHTHFRVTYEAEVSRVDSVDLSLSPEVFLPQSQLTKADMTALSGWLATIVKQDKLSQAITIMQWVFEQMTYSPGNTSVWHCVDALLKSPIGVCQDYAHLMISLLRVVGIPARYVAGIAQGEGETHAWVEAWIDAAWHGFDPTHNCLVHYSDPYMPFAIGRDATDCLLNAGQFVGNARQSMHVQAMLVKKE